jgi:thioredoxin
MKTTPKALIVLLLAAAIAGTLALKKRQPQDAGDAEAAEAEPTPEVHNPVADAPEPSPSQASAGLPKLLDLGADKCIPCKMMAPILDDLKKEYAGKMTVQFIDVWKNPDAGDEYGIQMIPTQIFYDPSGKEVFRHTGFYGREDILAKWKELGVALGSPADVEPALSRWKPAQPDNRPKDRVCYLCDGDIAPKTRSVMKTAAGDVAFCSPHCYLITYASITDETKAHENASVTDWTTGELTPVAGATYLYGMDERGRPTVKAFTGKAAAKDEQKRSGGNILAWPQFEAKETATRCGFCDRPVYSEDASTVRVAGMQTWGCCVMCALGVAARTGKNIEVETRDALTGEPIRVKTFEGHVAELDPPTAIAWGGARKDAEGKLKSTGCFKQAFLSDEGNLKKWLEKHPTATGRQMTIEQALAAKMKLTPQQISKACKIGECTPK